ncbi:MAG: SRPBCC family protein [Gemmatimonadota bacterium]
MWTVEHSIETTAHPGAVWRLWTAVPGWKSWNAGIESVVIHGPFRSGTRISMTPAGASPVEMTLGEVRVNELFVDQTPIEDILVTVYHRIEQLGAGQSRITYRMEITGPGADTLGAELGPMISADFPEVLAALAQRAEGR